MYLKQYLLHGDTVGHTQFKTIIYPKIVEHMFKQTDADEYYEDLDEQDVMNNYPHYKYEVLRDYVEDYLGIKCNFGYHDEWKIGNIIEKQDEIKAVEKWNFDFEYPTKAKLNKKIKKNQEFFDFIGLNTEVFKLSVSTDIY
jgi:hypothetical protein